MSLTRVTADNWRNICPCQRHGRGINLIEIHQLRGPFFALLIMSCLVFVGTTYPIEAMNLATLPSRLSITSQAVTASTSAAAAIETVKDESVEKLQLLTDAVRNGFLSPEERPRDLLSEAIKAEFFRSEVPYGSIIYTEALQNGLEPELVAAIVQTESDFRPTLLSNKNAHGLMQLIPSTAALMGVHDLFNPAENVRGGTKYLKYLQRQFEDPEMVLAAYNAGEAVVRKYNGIPPYTETQNFVKRVARNHERYERQLAERMQLAETLRDALAQ